MTSSEANSTGLGYGRGITCRSTSSRDTGMQIGRISCRLLADQHKKTQRVAGFCVVLGLVKSQTGLY